MTRFRDSEAWTAYVRTTFMPDPTSNLAPGIGLVKAEHRVVGTPARCAHGQTFAVSCAPCGRSVTGGGDH